MVVKQTSRASTARPPLLSGGLRGLPVLTISEYCLLLVTLERRS